MAIERPDWGDGSGTTSGAVVPGEDAVAVQASDSLPAITVRPTARSAPVVRDDWGDGRTPAPRRDEGGRFAADPLGHLDPELRERWHKEGGAERNMKAAQDTALRVLAGVDDPEGVAQHFDTLPQSIQNKVLDALRVSPTSRTTTFDTLDLIESMLTPQELAIAETWLKQLGPEYGAAILAGLGARR